MICSYITTCKHAWSHTHIHAQRIRIPASHSTTRRTQGKGAPPPSQAGSQVHRTQDWKLVTKQQRPSEQAHRLRAHAAGIQGCGQTRCPASVIRDMQICRCMHVCICVRVGYAYVIYRSIYVSIYRLAEWSWNVIRKNRVTDHERWIHAGAAGRPTGTRGVGNNRPGVRRAPGQ